MGDPLLNEHAIIALLQANPADKATAEIQAGAASALMDLYDRGATRAEFGEMALSCLGLYSQTAKLVLMLNIKAAYDRDLVTEETINEAISGLTNLVRKQSDTVIEIVGRLMQCPTSQDKVH
jgi:hypothetical protein